MLRLIVWLVGGYVLLRLWAQARRRSRGSDPQRPAPRCGPRIDRSQVVDAEFTDVDADADTRA